jgi:hypothetical protein
LLPIFRSVVPCEPSTVIRNEGSEKVSGSEKV